MTELVGSSLEELITERGISDPDKARRRLRLGYPTWFVLGDLNTKEVSGVLSRASGLPVLEKPLTSDLSGIGSTKPSAEPMLEELITEGAISDPDEARRRLRLGYPTWLIFGDLNTKEVSGVLSRASGLPVLEKPLTSDLVDMHFAQLYETTDLTARRWVPLVDGRIAIADPFGPLPDRTSANGLCIAPAREIYDVLDALSPGEEDRAKGVPRLGELLLNTGQISEKALALALDEQERSGGGLGEILLAHNVVDAPTLTYTLAHQLGLPVLQSGEEPKPLLPASQARAWRAVALSNDSWEAAGRQPALPVAFSDPSEEAVKAVRDWLRRPIQPKLTDEETLNRLLGEAYGEVDVKEATTSLRERRPYFSAYRNKLSLAQLFIAGALAIALAIGFAVNPLLPVIAPVAIASTFYIAYMVFRFYTAWVGWKGESTLNPPMEDLQNMDERELPTYTILLPVYGEKPSTLRELFRSLSKLDYPKQKLDGLLLVEADDRQTQEAIAAIDQPGRLKAVNAPPQASHSTPEGQYFDRGSHKVAKPGWLKVLLVPPGEPRTKPKAMIYSLLYAQGELLAVYDAEDQPDPYQLKKAVWGFQRVDDGSVACLQAKLNYYNPRQNLLTRWFTLEYGAWFDMFLPGLHHTQAPIPLGGTSNHFRTDVLREASSWDPYNVTEDADLGLRFARMGKRTMTLESTTYEEANSRLKNWIRQRSRWIKGYMQTLLVHTRHPLALYREVGLKGILFFLATVGGLIFTVLASPVFWAVLILWILAQPGWVPSLFPGPIYYMALASFFLGNFFFIFLGLIGAMGRGYDDLTPHALLIPFYWLLMSIAGYIALFELIVRPYYWQKTEHGLHLEEDAVSTPFPADTESTSKDFRGIA
jgi:cellulose synthase/poly-beta-1,6-N-acetylglucosamine synthase-like glycosyltransferase